VDENIPDWKSAGRGERFGEKNGTIKLLLCFDLGISEGEGMFVLRLSRKDGGSNMNWNLPTGKWRDWVNWKEGGFRERERRRV
jgi:hypothetical protein